MSRILYKNWDKRHTLPKTRLYICNEIIYVFRCILLSEKGLICAVFFYALVCKTSCHTEGVPCTAAGRLHILVTYISLILLLTCLDITAHLNSLFYQAMRLKLPQYPHRSQYSAPRSHSPCRPHRNSRTHTSPADSPPSSARRDT